MQTLTLERYTAGFCRFSKVILWVASKGQTISFSESSHVAYQIKADNAGSNMVSNILPTNTPSTQGVGLKGQTISFFLKVSN